MFLIILCALNVTHDTPCFRNKIEVDTDDSTVQGFKHREIELMSKNVKRKTKQKVFKKNLIDSPLCENDINTPAEELVSSENIRLPHSDDG